MSYDEQIRAALEAEAALAKVPARAIFERVKQSGVRVRQPSIWERIRLGRFVPAVGVAVVALGIMVAVPQLRSGLWAAQPAAGQGAQVPEAAAGPVTQYESRNLGFRVTFPSTFVGPEKDEQGALVFNSDKVTVTVERRPRTQGQVVEDLLGDLIAENFKQSRRLQPSLLGFRTISGREAAYFHTKYVSAAAWFERDTYGVVAGGHEYVITCGGRPGEQVAWETAGPLCDQVIEGVEVGTNLGYISQADALAAVRKAVPGPQEVTLAMLDEQFNARGSGVQPVWRVHVIVSGEKPGEYTAIVDARTGKVIYVENIATGERTTP